MKELIGKNFEREEEDSLLDTNIIKPLQVKLWYWYMNRWINEIMGSTKVDEHI